MFSLLQFFYQKQSGLGHAYRGYQLIGMTIYFGNHMI